MLPLLSPSRILYITILVFVPALVSTLVPTPVRHPLPSLSPFLFAPSRHSEFFHFSTIRLQRHRILRTGLLAACKRRSLSSEMMSRVLETMSLGTNYSFYYQERCQYFRIGITCCYEEHCLMCCPSNKVSRSDTISCLDLGGLHEDKVCHTLQVMTLTNFKAVHQTPLLHVENNLDRRGL